MYIKNTLWKQSVYKRLQIAQTNENARLSYQTFAVSTNSNANDCEYAAAVHQRTNTGKRVELPSERE